MKIFSCLKNVRKYFTQNISTISRICVYSVQPHSSHATHVSMYGHIPGYQRTSFPNQSPTCVVVKYFHSICSDQKFVNTKFFTRILSEQKKANYGIKTNHLHITSLHIEFINRLYYCCQII